jgi:hypothetical protein
VTSQARIPPAKREKNVTVPEISVVFFKADRVNLSVKTSKYGLNVKKLSPTRDMLKLLRNNTKNG